MTDSRPPSLPARFTLGPFVARPVRDENMGPLQVLAEADPDYFDLTAGRPPAADEAEQLRLGVIERNVRALRFWQRMGFTEERRVEREVRKDLTLTVLEMGREV